MTVNELIDKLETIQTIYEDFEVIVGFDGKWRPLEEVIGGVYYWPEYGCVGTDREGKDMPGPSCLVKIEEVVVLIGEES